MNRMIKKCLQSAFLFPIAPLFANFAYIGNNTDLTIVDTTTNTVVGTISLGVPPVISAITPNNRYVYVTQANDSVGVIDTSNNTVSFEIPLPGGSAPIGIAISPDGRKAYVANQIGTVSVISTATNQIDATISGFSQPWGIAVTPSGEFAYVVDLNGGFTPGFVTVIDLTTNTPLADTIPVGKGPTAIAITPDGRYAYVTNENENTVSVIDIERNTLAATIPVGTNPFQITASPNSQYVYVSNNAYTNQIDSSVSVISTATNTVVDVIPLYSSEPAGLAVTPDAQTLYVTNTMNTAVISTATNLVTGTISGSNTTSISITGTLIGNLRGKQKTNDFGLVREYFNQLEWLPTPYSDVIGYNVYRNGEKIASVNSATFQYNDHNQKKNVPVTYLVAPIEASGQESTPLVVVVK